MQGSIVGSWAYINRWLRCKSKQFISIACKASLDLLVFFLLGSISSIGKCSSGQWNNCRKPSSSSRWNPTRIIINNISTSQKTPWWNIWDLFPSWKSHYTSRALVWPNLSHDLWSKSVQPPFCTSSDFGLRQWTSQVIYREMTLSIV